MSDESRGRKLLVQQVLWCSTDDCRWLPGMTLDAMSAWTVERSLAETAARAGGRAALAYFRRPDLGVEWKPDDSPVTAADRASEQAIRDVLAAACPDDAVLGEEDGESTGSSGRRWIVDPIDGTRNFVQGVPLWAVLVALESDGQVQASCVGIPALDEWYVAARGAGALCNGAPIQVSTCDALAHSVWCYETRRWFVQGGLAALWDALDATTRLQRGLCDAYAHMLIATGRAELVIEPELSLWDKAAPSLVVEEAGGRFTDLGGMHGIHGVGAVVSNGRVHNAALEMIGATRA